MIRRSYKSALALAALGSLWSLAPAANAQSGITIYSNETTPETTPTNGVYIAVNGGAAVIGSGATANTITKMLFDDINVAASNGGTNVFSFTFHVANLNAVAVNVRPRIRFFQADNGTAPGTFITGYTFNPISFPANAISGFYTDFTAAPSSILIPANGKFFVGITFDNGGDGNTAGEGTVAQLNNFGVPYYNPPTVGTSADSIYYSNAAGSFFGVSSPPATQETAGGGGGPTVSNLEWSFRVAGDTISGMVDYPGRISPSGDPAGAPYVTVEFRTPGTTNAVFSQRTQVDLGSLANPDSDGKFTVQFDKSKHGTYDVALKGDNTLRVSKQSVPALGGIVINGPVTLPTVTLLGGDANGDNSVDNLDLGLLAAAYATFNGDAAFDPSADFNYDSAIDNLDLSILANNYVLSGDD